MGLGLRFLLGALSLLGVWAAEGFSPGEAQAQVQQAWVRRYNSPTNDNDVAAALAVDGAGNVYVTGRSFFSGAFLDYATVKYDSDGNRKWMRHYNGPGGFWDEAHAIAVDGEGNVYVTGYSYGNGTVWDYATIKYDTNGNRKWVRRYNGPGNMADSAQGIAVDGAGNVYVTGFSDGGLTGNDYATIKYDTNGNQKWVRRYNGPGNGSDEPTAIAVDGAGNVYITGESFGAFATFVDYATVKYDTDGNQKWVRRYSGPGNGFDYGKAIAVDGEGNVYVTGYSHGKDTSYDYATVKYDTDGNQMWVKRYNGPGNAWDFASALALDKSGNVYVTGTSEGGDATWQDYATIKYTQTP